MKTELSAESACKDVAIPYGLQTVKIIMYVKVIILSCNIKLWKIVSYFQRILSHVSNGSVGENVWT
jgi:hypothetical protein